MKALIRPQLRFWDKVLVGDGCWEWQGNKQAGGYGTFTIGRKNVIAHRFAYEDRIGPIPVGLQIDHLCRNRACVNPGHLEAVTCRENSLRSPFTSQSINAAKTHCPQGHPYDEANTYHTPGDPIGRYCRICMRQRWRAWYARSKT